MILKHIRAIVIVIRRKKWPVWYRQCFWFCLNTADFNLFSLFLLLLHFSLNMHSYRGYSRAVKMKRVTVHWRGIVQRVTKWNVTVAVIKLNLGLAFIHWFIQLTKFWVLWRCFYEQPGSPCLQEPDILNGSTTLNNMHRQITKINDDFPQAKFGYTL